MPSEFGRQFRWSMCKLNYGYPDDFVLHQWQETATVDGLFMIYRFFFLAFLTLTCYMVLRQTLWDHALAWKRTIYFSFWTLIVCWLNALFGCILVILNFAFQYEEKTDTYLYNSPILIKLYWITNTIAVDCSLTLVIIFWTTLLVWGAYINLGMKVWLTLMGLCMLLDSWVVSLPVRLMHYYIVLIFIIIYAAFDIIYQLLLHGTNLDGKDYIYIVIDWKKNPLKAVLYIFLTFVVTIAMRLLVYDMHRMKNYISNRVFESEERSVDNASSVYDGKSATSMDGNWSD